MSYDADPRSIMRRVSDWGAQAVITRDDYSAVESLVQHHYDDRSRVFEDLVNALKRDTDIQSPWDSVCDKGLDLNERLRSAVESKLNSAGGRGYIDSGMNDFYDGEKIAWGACKSGRIGLIAEAIHDIEINNTEIFKKLEEDLKKCREDAAVVDELVRSQFKEWQSSLGGVFTDVAANGVALPVAMIPGVGKIVAPKIKDWLKVLLGGDAKMRELAKKKAAARAILAANDEMVANAQAQIGDSAIEDIRKRAEELARSWKDTTRNDYHSDWEAVGKACVEVLNEKASRAKEKAQKLYNDMRPLYIEALKTSFMSILIDPSSLANFKDQLDNDLKKMFEELGKQSNLIAQINDSGPKRSAVADMQEVTKLLNEAIAQHKRDLDEQEQLAKMGK